jgi:hypothetical protein
MKEATNDSIASLLQNIAAFAVPGLEMLYKGIIEKRQQH